MLETLDPIFLITAGGLIGIAVVAFLEIAILPFFIFPGDSLLFAGGYLAAEGHFNIILLMIVIALSTIAGGFMAYFIGRKVGIRFTEKPPSFIRPSYIEKTNHFYKKHGAKTILLMRFVPVVRTLAPLFAGIGGMRMKIFAPYNIIGGIIWAGSITLLGFFFGKYIPNLSHYVSIGILVLVGASIFFMIFSMYFRRGK
jgi:membrane-associated protein